MPAALEPLVGEGDRDQVPLSGGYLQHDFDSRGVVREYEMLKATPSEDGATFTGAWERTQDGDWVHDFDVVYERTAA